MFPNCFSNYENFSNLKIKKNSLLIFPEQKQIIYLFSKNKKKKIIYKIKNFLCQSQIFLA